MAACTPQSTVQYFGTRQARFQGVALSTRPTRTGCGQGHMSRDGCLLNVYIVPGALRSGRWVVGADADAAQLRGCRANRILSNLGKAGLGGIGIVGIYTICASHQRTWRLEKNRRGIVTHHIIPCLPCCPVVPAQHDSQSPHQRRPALFSLVKLACICVCVCVCGLREISSVAAAAAAATIAKCHLWPPDPQHTHIIHGAPPLPIGSCRRRQKGWPGGKVERGKGARLHSGMHQTLGSRGSEPPTVVTRHVA